MMTELMIVTWASIPTLVGLSAVAYKINQLR